MRISSESNLAERCGGSCTCAVVAGLVPELDPGLSKLLSAVTLTPIRDRTKIKGRFRKQERGHSNVKTVRRKCSSKSRCC